jgi:hypothetical protein
MIRSIVSFFKLWLRCDFSALAQAEHLHQLPRLLKPAQHRSKGQLRPRSPNPIAANRRSSLNTTEVHTRRRFGTTRLTPLNETGANNVTKLVYRPTSPCQESESRFNSTTFVKSVKKKGLDRESVTEKLKNKTTVYSSEQAELSCQSSPLNNTSLHAQSKTTFTKSMGMNCYFPNKTTSNKNHIVRMILEHDSDPNFFGKNNILLDEEKLRELELQKLKRMKESLQGIGEEFNDLFQSTLLEEGGMNTSHLGREFQALLQ